MNRYHKRAHWVPLLVLVLSLLTLLIFVSNAAALNLVWDPVTAEGSYPVTGYKIHYGTSSGDYTEVADVGNVTSYHLYDLNLTPYETYYFVVAAYTSIGEEGFFSDEVVTLSITSPEDGFYVNAGNYTSYTVSGTANTLVNVEIFADGASLGTTTTGADGTWSIDVDFTGIIEGAISLTAASGGISLADVTGTFDKTLPTSSITSPANGENLNTVSTITGTSSDGSGSGVQSVEIQVTDGTYYLQADNSWTTTETWFAPSGGTLASWTHDVSGVIFTKDTTYTAKSRATDKAGNIQATPDEIPPDKTPNDSSGCSIATAVYGSPFESHVKILCKFRDVYLLPTRLGHAFVDTYYRYSPKAAAFIADHESLRAMVRVALLPVVGMSYLMLCLGTFWNLAAFAGLAMLLTLAMVRIRRGRMS